MKAIEKIWQELKKNSIQKRKNSSFFLQTKFELEGTSRREKMLKVQEKSYLITGN